MMVWERGGFGEVLLSLCLGFNFVLWLWMEVRYFG